MDTLEFLREQPLFAGFAPEKIAEVLGESRIESFKRGDVIISQGEPGWFLGIMIEGSAEAAMTDQLGERRRLGAVRPGGVVGEMSLMTGEPTSADVVALADCRMMLMRQDIFTRYLVANPQAIRFLSRTIAERFAERENIQVSAARKGAAAQDPYGLELRTRVAMNLLVINCGSSSVKYSFYDTTDEHRHAEGQIERIGAESACHAFSGPKGASSRQLGKTDHAGAMRALVAAITHPEQGVLRDIKELSAIGHRVVHGGDRYSNAAVVDDEVVGAIEEAATFAPLHNPVNLLGIRAALEAFPGVPNVAVFDTAFHARMPPSAFLYGLPYEYYERDRLRRYGFHGASHKYVSLAAATFLGRRVGELKIISCHLGNGASVAAVEHGRSVDTSMGMTPVEGLIMGTRAGDVDAGIIVHIARKEGLTPDELDKLLNKRSGLLGLSGVSSDMREVQKAAGDGHRRALLALRAFSYRVRKYIGAGLAAIGGLDALIFTGGIGEGSAEVRALATQGLAGLGIAVDDGKNRGARPGRSRVADITGRGSKARVLVVHTDESRMIARETIRALGRDQVAALIHNNATPIPIEVSARHVHLKLEHVEALFGAGYKLTVRGGLSQPGQFACEETVDLIGPKDRVQRVRILGPERKESQVEISMTEEYALGIHAPVRMSGDLAGTPGLTLEGPKGTLVLDKGLILAQRHIHMPPEDALSFGLMDRDVVQVRIAGGRELVFGDVTVRVHPSFRLAMHLDTDEANAAQIKTGQFGALVSLQHRRH
ncbi:MAG: acetate/propionate family kinase [Elusimicrobia bacterium]|nr:acetate/propionate family kinase [Elusimicrobiota bacterium]